MIVGGFKFLPLVVPFLEDICFVEIVICRTIASTL